MLNITGELSEQAPGAAPSVGERGVSMVSTALLMPLILTVMVVLFDLSRLYLNGIFAQEVAMLVAKLAVSADPDGYALPDVERLVYPPAGEGRTGRERENFWAKFLDPVRTPRHGKNYLTEKERKVLNLAYGFVRQLSPRVYFPIPVGFESNLDLLGGRPNCSIYFEFAEGLEAAPDPVSEGAAFEEYLRRDRDRIFYVDCVVPLIALSIDGLFSGPAYRVISRNAYAFRSGSIRNNSFTATPVG